MPQSDGGASAFNFAISSVIALALSLLLRPRWLRHSVASRCPNAL